MKLSESAKKALVFVALASLVLFGSAGLFLPSSSPTNPSQTANDSKDITVKDITIGDGKEAGGRDVVTLHYIGEFEDGRIFDSSYRRGQPFSFMLGAGQVIPGMELGVRGMKVGGKRIITIPSELGYGEKGVEGVIPPYATLIFTIELLDTTSPES